jgi:hypothetical protein
MTSFTVRDNLQVQKIIDKPNFFYIKLRENDVSFITLDKVKLFGRPLKDESNKILLRIIVDKYITEEIVKVYKTITDVIVKEYNSLFKSSYDSDNITHDLNCIKKSTAKNLTYTMLRIQDKYENIYNQLDLDGTYNISLLLKGIYIRENKVVLDWRFDYLEQNVEEPKEEIKDDKQSEISSIRSYNSDSDNKTEDDNDEDKDKDKDTTVKSKSVDDFKTFGFLLSSDEEDEVKKEPGKKTKDDNHTENDDIEPDIDEEYMKEKIMGLKNMMNKISTHLENGIKTMTSDLEILDFYKKQLRGKNMTKIFESEDIIDIMEWVINYKKKIEIK